MKTFVNLHIIIVGDSFLQNVFEYMCTEMQVGYIPIPVYLLLKDDKGTS